MEPTFKTFEEEQARTKREAELRMKRWRRTFFETEEGKLVWLDIMGALQMLVTVAPTEEVIIRQNIGRWMLAEVGVMQPGQEEALLEALISIPPRPFEGAENLIALRGKE